MCGFVGIFSKHPIDMVGLFSAREVIVHRGPDDYGDYVSDGRRVGLAFRRLSVIDLSPAGNQPMANEDRTIWIVFNGEIYNYVALRRDLEAVGHHFASGTDTEVIIHGYEEWGTDVVSRLRGMFAFAIWDENRRQVFLARDRIGVKPLFYYSDRKQFVFASEIKAIFAMPGISRVINFRGIYDYLTYRYIPAPYTAYADIFKLPPGHTLCFDGSTVNVQQYWDVDLTCRLNGIAEPEAVELVKERLEDAVRSHLVSDVPVGLFLSGGMDSSSIAVCMAEIQDQSFHTFSVGFDVQESSELSFARLVAKQVRSHHHERVLTWPQALAQLEQVIQVYDEPFADTSSVPTMEISRLAREQVKVALSGEGGDEAFGGYTWYKQWHDRNRLQYALPDWLCSGVVALGRAWPKGFRGQGFARMLADQAFGPLEQYARLMEWISLDEKHRIVPSERLRELGEYDDYWNFRQHWHGEVDSITRMQYLDIKTYLPDQLLVKADRASMSVSLEVRVPLLDHLLLETLLAIPGELRFKNGKTKYLQRLVMKDRLPQTILTRPKMGFVPPISCWITPDKRGWVNSLLHDGAAVKLGLIRPDSLDALDTHGWAAKIWVLLVLESWARQEVGDAPISSGLADYDSVCL